jgi:hypothetical protein
MNSFKKFKKLEEILGAERVEENIVETVEKILSFVIYLYNENLELTTLEELNNENLQLCDTVYEDEYISIEPLEDRELNEIKAFLVWLKEDEEYKKRYYLKIKEV